MTEMDFYKTLARKQARARARAEMVQRIQSALSELGSLTGDVTRSATGTVNNLKGYLIIIVALLILAGTGRACIRDHNHQRTSDEIAAVPLFRAGATATAQKRTPSAYELATADYTGLAETACAKGWNAIIRAGGFGQFDKANFDRNCVDRVTQVGVDCGRVKHTAEEISDCVREAAPGIAKRVLMDSQ